MPIIRGGDRGKCPHCQVVVLFETLNWTSARVDHIQSTNGLGGVTHLYLAQCPSCKREILSVKKVVSPNDDRSLDMLLIPLAHGRPQAPVEVPTQIANDYNEAALVLPFSSKASAALARRCLQAVLTDPGAGKSTNRDLNKQIEEVAESLPSDLGKNLHYVREIGNFAAHPQKSIRTGEILDIEAGEAQWSLDVLESLFDYFYVLPSREREKRSSFDPKVQEAGRRTLNKAEIEATSSVETDVGGSKHSEGGSV